MAENNYFFPKPSRLGVNYKGLQVLGRAVRNNNKVKLSEDKSANKVIDSRPTTSRHLNQLSFQMYETIRESEDSTTPQQLRNYFPLGTIVSKTATRKHLQKNTVDLLDKFDSTTIRKKPLPPPWREKEADRRKFRSAYLYNRRKIEEIQAMKIKLKCPRYDPTDLIQGRRYHSLCTSLSESQSKPSIKTNIPNVDDGGSKKCSQQRSLIMESEDPLVDDDSGINRSFEKISNEKENFVFNLSPTVQPEQNKFVWNPVILPTRFGSGIELLKHHDSLPSESSYEQQYLDSPGNYTTSSTSSGFTVAEETLKLTYCAKRRKEPVYDERIGSDSFSSETEEDTGLEGLNYSYQPNFINYFEE